MNTPILRNVAPQVHQFAKITTESNTRPIRVQGVNLPFTVWYHPVSNKPYGQLLIVNNFTGI